MVTNDTLSNCPGRESCAGRCLSLGTCELWAPVPRLRVRNFLQSLTASRRYRRSETRDQWAMCEQMKWLILKPGQCDSQWRRSLVKLVVRAWQCSGYSGTGDQCGAVWGEARPGWGRGGRGGARWAPSLRRGWPSTRSPVTWDSWTERICTFNFRWDFPLFTINLLLFVLSSPPAWAMWMCFHVMLYAARETVRDPSMLDMTDIVTWLVTWHSIMSYSTVSNVTPIKFKYRCDSTQLFGKHIYFLWLKTTELMLHVCLTFKYFPKVSKNKVSWHFHRKFTKFMVSFVAGRLTRLRAPGSRFCPSRHFGDRLLWAPVHGREECHKMDRPGQVHQETNLQTTRYTQRNNLFMIMLDCRVQY